MAERNPAPAITERTVIDFEDWRLYFLKKYNQEPNRHDTWQEAKRQAEMERDADA